MSRGGEVSKTIPRGGGGNPKFQVGGTSPLGPLRNIYDYEDVPGYALFCDVDKLDKIIVCLYPSVRKHTLRPTAN